MKLLHYIQKSHFKDIISHNQYSVAASQVHVTNYVQNTEQRIHKTEYDFDILTYVI